MGVFDDFMRGIARIFEFFADTIRAILTAAEKIVIFIGTEILPILAFVITGIVMLVSVIAIFFPVAATTIVNFLVYGITVIKGGTALMIEAGPFSVGMAMTGLKTVLATFLEAIHFRTIMAVHNILWVLSEDYRKVMSKLFKTISEVSEELFGWSMGMEVMLRNTRVLVVSSAAILGITYDVAELMWLTQMETFLVGFNDRVESYMEDPEQFFIDLQVMVEQHAIDLSAGRNQLIFEAVTSLTQGVLTNAENLVRIDSAVSENQFKVGGLIGEDHKGGIADNRRGHEQFKRDEYKPRQDQQETSITQNKARSMENKRETDRIAKKMTTPTGQIDEIDELEEPQKTEEEEKLEDLSTRPYQEESEELKSEKETAAAEQEKELTESEKEMKEKLREEPVFAEPVTPLEVKPGPPVNFWSVGDY